MVRQALFSSLAARIPGSRFLDVFAGSGAVGLDAWSRGAGYVCWVESDPRTLQVLEQNVRTLCGGASGGGEDQGWRVVRSDGLRFLEGVWRDKPYDVVFADPPYDRTGNKEWGRLLLAALAQEGRLAEGGLFILEQASEETRAYNPAWDVLLDKEYGGTRLLGYKKTEDHRLKTGAAL